VQTRPVFEGLVANLAMILKVTHGMWDGAGVPS
jgi:hypothetical protein